MPDEDDGPRAAYRVAGFTDTGKVVLDRIDLNARERDVIEHSLGLSRSRTPYRNHFCASPGHDDWDTLLGLVSQGLMTRRDPRPGVMPDYCFHVTDAGAAAVGTALSKPIIES